MTADHGDETAGNPRREVGGRDLPLAIASGVVLASAFLASLFWHAAALGAVAGSLVVVGLIEAARVLRERHAIEVATPVLLVTALIAFVGAYQVGEAGILVGVVVLFLGAVAWELANADRTGVVRNVSLTAMLGLWVPINAAFAVLLVGGGAGPHTPEALLAVGGGVIFTDIGGFAFGVPFGRHKLAPTVSPAKSWEGLIGGLALTAALAVAVLPQISDYDAVTSVFVAVLAGLAGFVGDLVESMFKRDLGVKDLGDILPGHGGVLDRVDGLLLSLPVGYYALQILS
ncbi:MAG TPA: phosphatidate cytidylyltransferase [Nitriliruptorales bacterium]